MADNSKKSTGNNSVKWRKLGQLQPNQPSPEQNMSCNTTNAHASGKVKFKNRQQLPNRGSRNEGLERNSGLRKQNVDATTVPGKVQHSDSTNPKQLQNCEHQGVRPKQSIRSKSQATNVIKVPEVQHGNSNHSHHLENCVIAKDPRPMTSIRMRELQTKPPNEVVSTLLDRSEGFLKLIAQTNLSHEKLILIFAVLAVACKSDKKEGLKDLLTHVQSIQQFTLATSQSYVCELQNNILLSREEHLANFITFLETLQDLDPNKTSILLTMLLPQLMETISALDSIVSRELADRITELNIKNKQCREKYSISFLSEVERPPNDFRCIPLFPDATELGNKHPFLRPNIIDGQYTNTEHYLDVQFRLLREDFVRPLREGLSSYKKQVKNKEKHVKLQDVHIYNNVHIGQPMINQKGVVRRVQFDVNPFKHRQWKTSKRLIFGSFVCFSPDNFQTIISGTVADSNPDDLKHGTFSVKLEDYHMQLENQKTTFVMVESHAYFEAYRYNLEALQSIGNATLPFKKFIVELSQEVSPPLYISSEIEKYKRRYCLKPLLDATKMIVNDENLFGLKNGMSRRFAIKKGCCQPAQYCDILNYSTWPSCSELGLDKSQFDALKMALTKELAIIQGPPGTGKTFVGLKIIQVLLHNSKFWNTPDEDGQILVICYTNHALDQFLEGILKYTNRIVRIGGRSQNVKLDAYAMNKLKKFPGMKKKHTPHIHKDYLDVKHQLKELEKEINDLHQKLKNCQNVIMTEDLLRVVMDTNHFSSLTEGYANHIVKCKPVMPYWLCVAIPGTKEYYEQMDFNNEDNSKEKKDCSEDGTNKTCAEETNIASGDIKARLDGDVPVAPKGKTPKRVASSSSGCWKIQAKNKQQQQEFESLQKSTAMSMKEIQRVSDVWHLYKKGRRELYKAWIEMFCLLVSYRLKELYQIYSDKHRLSMELSLEEDFFIASRKEVIGMTTTGAAKYQSLLKRLKTPIVIIEEAAEVMEAHIVTALTESAQHLILIGDHQQLRPNPTVYELAKHFNLDVSLFERLVNNGLPFCRLGIQHRMKPCIAKLLVPHIYESLEDHASVKAYEDVKGMTLSMFFINHKMKEQSECDGTSRRNVHEAEYLMRLCKYLLLQGYRPDQITILATYTGQLLLLKRLMETSWCKDVHVTVVDNFQGEENDIILLSLVRSNEEGVVGFLKIENRVCVALSRAKKGLYCIGNFDLLKQESKLWENIYQELMCSEAIGPDLDLHCQNHGNFTSIKELKDFDGVINGGCSKPCDFNLQCGHSCVLLCHPYDKDHVEYMCSKPCDKSCVFGHKCPKVCHLPCGPCKVIVPKVLMPCGHGARVACYLDPVQVKCDTMVTKVLEPCQHEVRVACHIDSASLECDVIVSKTLEPCGHDVEIACHVDPAEVKCNVIMLKALQPCGHDAQIACHKSPLEEKCLVPCTKILNCGHECLRQCSDECVPCKVLVTVQSPCGHEVRLECGNSGNEEFVKKKCFHRCVRLLSCKHPCYTRCGLPCPPCKVKVTHVPPCGHNIKIECSATNSEEKVLAACNHTCGITLDCGHTCSGTCFTCSQGRIHLPCEKACGKRLICGHTCKSICCENCPPCSRNCENYCSHNGMCQQECGIPCIPCQEPCTWKCKHLKCTMKCSEPCNRLPCKEPCPKKLRCGHKCIGLCGEPCPEFCRICDKKIVSEHFFGNEDHPSALFIQLDDCGHIFEVDGLNKWITSQISSKMRLPTCPKCKTVIRFNVHLSSYIKTCLSNVEKVKLKGFGNWNQIILKWNHLLSIIPIQRSDIWERWVNEAKGIMKCPKKQAYSTLTTILNMVFANLTNGHQIISMDLLVQLENVLTFVSEIKTIQNILDFVGIKMEEVYSKHVISSVAILTQVIMNNFDVMSNQLMDEIHWELRRLFLLTDIVKDAEKYGISENSEAKALFATATDTLMMRTPFREIHEMLVQDTRNTLSELIFPETEVVANEKRELVKAVSLKQELWYSCPNGHVFCTIKSEDAAAGSFCNECMALARRGN